MKKNIILALCLAVAFFVLAFTCPDKEAHSEAITYKVSIVVNEKIDNGENENPLGFLGSMYVSKIIGEVLESRLKVNNYLIFSTGEINYKGEVKTISFGILNHVFTIGKEDVERNLEEMSSNW